MTFVGNSIPDVDYEPLPKAIRFDGDTVTVTRRIFGESADGAAAGHAVVAGRLTDEGGLPIYEYWIDVRERP